MLGFRGLRLGFGLGLKPQGSSCYYGGRRAKGSILGNFLEMNI